MTLFDLKPGQWGYVVKVRGRGAFRKRVIEMGFTKGRKVEVLRKAPLQDPIEYRVMGYEISLRRSEARFIEIVTEDELELNEQSAANGLISEEYLYRKLKEKGKVIDVALVGNPNCGKTTLFNFASGASEHVGNYSGVTVEATTGTFNYRDYKFNLVDLPGTYSLSAFSPEELFVRRHLLTNHPDVIINVLDSSNLERNLFLTTQLMELDLRMVVALNMYDELQQKGDRFDHEHLGTMLGIPFIPTVGHRNKGINDLLDKVIEAYEMEDSTSRKACIRFSPEVETSIEKLQHAIESSHFVKESVSARFYAIKLLEKDPEIHKISSRKEFNDIHESTHEEIRIIENFYRNDTENIIADARYGFIAGALHETLQQPKQQGNIKTRTERIDGVLTHKFWGYPIFIAFLWLMFFSTFFLGSFPMKWMEQGIAVIGQFVADFMSDGLLKELITDGIINGVGGVLVFLPNILILFLFIAFMEDTGYMARVAFLMDRLMHRIGLHGKSFIPLVMGFGCNVPAIMATRTLENPSDRLLTILINPFMSCSARLPVYILIIGAVFPSQPVLVLFLVYIIGILFASLFALLFKSTIFRKSEAPFVMELPPYRLPTRKVVFRHMWFRASQYLRKMGGIILLASIIIWGLGRFPNDTGLEERHLKQQNDIMMQYNNHSSDSLSVSSQTELALALEIAEIEFQQQRQAQSYLARIGKFIEPIMRPLGFDWRLTVCLISGITAKEVVVSTMSVLFSSADRSSSSRIENISEIRNDNLSLRLRAAHHQSGSSSGSVLLDPVTAFAFLMFILLYFPCIAVIAAIRKETGGWKWAIFTISYTTVLAWFVAWMVQLLGSAIL